jgi:hypothetical protein
MVFILFHFILANDHEIVFVFEQKKRRSNKFYRDGSNKQKDSFYHRISRHEYLFLSLRKNHHDNYHHSNLRHKLSIDVSPTSAIESENHIHDKVHQQRLPPHENGMKMK